MNRFENLVAAAKKAQLDNANAKGTHVAYGAAVDGEFRVLVVPVEGHVRALNTVRFNCFINDKRVSKEKMQAAMK